jgi:hypothetical protein
MAKKKPTHNTRNASGKPVMLTKDHVPDAPNRHGEDERRIAYQEHCFSLSMKGWTQREIAEDLAKTFNLVSVPSHVTIAAHIRGAVTHRKESMADKRDAYLAIAIPRLEAIVKNMLPIATNESGDLYVRRVTKHFGEEREVLDEETLAEQVKAAETIIKCTEQVRKLLGIGINEKGEDEVKLTEGRMQTLIFAAITNNISNGSNGHTKQIGSLPLTSGDPAIDSLEAGSL